MSRNTNKIQDFVTNQEFKNWVLEPNPARDDFWKAWLESNPEMKRELLLAREIITRLEFKTYKPPNGTASKILKNILHNHPGKKIDASLFADHSTGGWWPKLAIAAVFALLVSLAIGFSVYYYLPVQNVYDLAKETTVKENPPGRKTYFFLPDGTQVWLNAESRIEYSEFPLRGARQIKLEGEAYFDVTPSKNSTPFEVICGEIVITALGTSFNIKAFNDDNFIQVVLTEGRVRVYSLRRGKEVFLEAGDVLFYSKNDQELKTSKLTPSMTAWKDGTIHFEEDSLEAIVAKLERWYGVKIQVVGTKSASWYYSGEFTNQSLENVLKSMSYVEGFEFEIDGGSITIYLK